HTDEAPMLATASFLPILDAFSDTAGIDVTTRDISLAGRIVATFSDLLPEEQREADALAELGELAKSPEANIIKLPNISASVPQLKAAIAELQGQGIALPDYPESPETDAEKDVRARYDSIKGSAVNPVLREGNSDRRAPAAVKNFAKAHPHRMGEWSADSKTSVATMEADDFRANEQSVVLEAEDTLSIVHVATDGTETVLKASLPVLAGEVVDSTVMRAAALDAFLREQIAAAKEQGVLFSLHLKATMMKVSDPILFGHAVRAFLPTVFTQFGEQLEQAGLSPNNGLGGILAGVDALDAEQRDGIRAAIDTDLAAGPDLAMVNSHKGITNLHVPSDVIIDASMPAMIRTSGHMWNADDAEQDTLAVIPDSSYAGVYSATVEDCQKNGAFDPTTMGTVPNVGLMAQKAEEYGSHDKTFEIAADGRVEVRDASGTALMTQEVAAGDIFRACQAKDAPIRDWVQLAVRRSRESGMPAVFWLDDSRAHDRNVTAKVEAYLAEEDTDGLDIQILAPIEATKHTLERVRRGEDTISVTGNVLRDYLTDLQLIEEDYLRWDSLGEFLALAESLRHLARTASNERARVLADALDRATETLLTEGKSPQRKLGSIDNRGSHFYLAMYWAQELAQQSEDTELATAFGPIAKELTDGEQTIADELLAVQGKPADIGGYYRPDLEKISAVMRPSATFNRILEEISAAL
ncbi:MAG: NADP-dependent isocitrate dehydrogenase, partial [Brachybacterium tyrofermentans]